LRNGRGVAFHARIEKVFATESVKSVDEDGNVESGGKTKEAEIRAIGGAAPGAIIGGVAGGAKGVAIGAIIGAGVSSVYVQGDKDLIIEQGSQVIVRVTVQDDEGAMTRL
jgi:hypothetical protein